MATDASFHKLRTDKDDAVYAFVRTKENSKAVVLVNLSARPQEFTVVDDLLGGPYFQDVFSGDSVMVEKKHTFKMKPWEYLVYRSFAQ